MKKMIRALRAPRKKDDFATMVRDPEGEERVIKLGAQLKSAGKVFVDDQFPANAKMLFDDPASPPPFMHNVVEAHKKGLIKWLRPNEMGDTTEKFQVFAEGIDPEDINQGAIGDCYFLAALSICATREELINDLIVEDCAEQGIYGVKFFAKGTWQTVIVDDLLPCWEIKGQWLPIFCTWKGEKETWAMLAEKAWAKLHGSYEAIDGGRTEDALGYLSGGCTTTNFFKDREERLVAQVTNGSLWRKLLVDLHSNSKEQGCFISASGVKERKGTKKGDHNPADVDKGAAGLVSGHAYSVLDIREVQGHQLIQLRNPWGSYEWGGDWSDNSPLWTESMKKEVDFVAADDGAFWMSFKDFTNEFSQCGVCKTVPPTWRTKFLKSQWKAPHHAGGSFEATGHFNPIFELKNEDPVVWIQLELPDQRKEKGDWTISDLRVLKKPKEMAEIDIYDSVVPPMTLSERQKSVEVRLEPSEGPYYVLVNAWHAGIEGTFYLTVHSPAHIDLEPVSTLQPSPQEAALIVPVVFPNHCVACQKAVIDNQKKSLKGIKWHEECYKCATCPSTDVYDVGQENGKWNGFCFPCWNPKFGEKCLECGKSVQTSKAGGEPVVSVNKQGKLHTACREAWKAKEIAKRAQKCFFCPELIFKVEGKFSGEYYDVENHGKIHNECYGAWKKSTAPKCVQCHEPIWETAGKFTGKFYTVEGGGVHEECRDHFNQSKAKACVHCSQPLLKIEGKFTGRFLPVGEAGVHEECIVPWKASTADKCIHCAQPVCEIPGKFSGAYFPIDGKGKLHEECGDAWKKS